MTKRGSRWLCGFGVALAILLTAGPVADAKKKKKTEWIERISARALSMGVIATGSTDIVNISISSWTSDEERVAMLEILAEGGSAKLVDAFRETERVGFIRLSNTRGWDLHYARQQQIEGGRVIIFATDRPIGFGEVYNRNNSLDYNLMIGRVTIPDEGNGDGVLAVGVDAVINKETGSLELENFSSEPLRLSHVRSRM